MILEWRIIIFNDKVNLLSQIYHVPFKPWKIFHLFGGIGSKQSANQTNERTCSCPEKSNSAFMSQHEMKQNKTNSIY